MVNNDDLVSLAQRKLYEAGIPVEQFTICTGAGGMTVEAMWCGQKRQVYVSKEELAALPRAAKVVNGVDLNKGHAFVDYQGMEVLVRQAPPHVGGAKALSIVGDSETGILLKKSQARALGLLLLNWAVEDTLET